jgi:hypothetical protein
MVRWKKGNRFGSLKPANRPMSTGFTPVSAMSASV